MPAILVHTIGLGIVKAYALEAPGASIIVDSGYPGTDLEAAIAVQAPGLAPVRAAILTHAHLDHFGGFPGFLARHQGLPMACGAFDAQGLREGINVDLEPLGAKGRFFSLASRGGKPGATVVPTRLLEDGHSLAEWGIEGVLVATPGHTRGSMSIFLPEARDASGKELGPTALVGDLVMGGFVLHAFPGPPFFASGWEELRASMARLKALGVRTILPGHGGPLEAARVYRRYRVY